MFDIALVSKTPLTLVSRYLNMLQPSHAHLQGHEVPFSQPPDSNTDVFMLAIICVVSLRRARAGAWFLRCIEFVGWLPKGSICTEIVCLRYNLFLALAGAMNNPLGRKKFSHD